MTKKRVGKLKKRKKNTKKEYEVEDAIEIKRIGSAVLTSVFPIPSSSSLQEDSYPPFFFERNNKRVTTTRNIKTIVISCYHRPVQAHSPVFGLSLSLVMWEETERCVEVKSKPHHAVAWVGMERKGNVVFCGARQNCLLFVVFLGLQPNQPAGSFHHEGLNSRNRFFFSLQQVLNSKSKKRDEQAQQFAAVPELSYPFWSTPRRKGKDGCKIGFVKCVSSTFR